jgi:hypothetical protein
MTPQERAAKSAAAIDELEEVILDVVREATEQGQCPGTAEVSRRAGIHRLPAGGAGGTTNWNDGIATHLLNKLLIAGKVERCPFPNTNGGPGKRGWKLAPKT